MERENIQTQNSLLGFRINLCFDDYKLAIVIDELGCKFIIIDPGKKYLVLLKSSMKYSSISNNCLLIKLFKLE